MSKQQVQAHLLDALMSNVVLPPQPPRDVVLDEGEVFEHNEALRLILASVTCIEASNVARFFADSYESDSEAFWSDLKCLVPPHEKFFVEWERPVIGAAKRMGMLFVACHPEQAEATARAFLGAGAHTTPAKITEFRQDARCRWIFLTFDFMEFPTRPDDGHISGFRGPYHVGTVSVAEDGTLLKFWMSHASVLSEEQSMHVGIASLVGWTTVAMLNCANIDTVAHHVPDAFQRARTRRGKKPLVSYHTIRVNLDKTPRSIAAEQLPGDAPAKRLHRKRGHMKDYRRGKGLFGRYKGIWYWGPSLSGSEDAGVVVSDYEVTP